MPSKWSPGCNCCDTCEECTDLYSLDWLVRLCNVAAVDNTPTLTAGEQAENDAWASDINNLLISFDLTAGSNTYTGTTSGYDWRVRQVDLSSIPERTVYCVRESDNSVTGVIAKNLAFIGGIAWLPERPCDIFLHMTFYIHLGSPLTGEYPKSASFVAPDPGGALGSHRLGSSTDKVHLVSGSEFSDCAKPSDTYIPGRYSFVESTIIDPDRFYNPLDTMTMILSVDDGTPTCP